MSARRNAEEADAKMEMDAKDDLQEGDLVDSEDDGAMSDGSKTVDHPQGGSQVVPKLLAAKRQVRGFGAMAPPNKKLDDRWDDEEINLYASTIEDGLPPRPREQSATAIVQGTLDTMLGIRKALQAAGLEVVARTIQPDSPGNYKISGLTPETWGKLDLAVGSLRPRNTEVHVKAVPPPAWLDYEDLSLLIIPKHLMYPEEVAVGYPDSGFPRPIRMYRTYGPKGRRKAVKAVFESLVHRGDVLRDARKFKISFEPAKVVKKISNPEPKPQTNRPKKQTPPGNKARRGKHE
jgi:hypothetical protein